MPRPRNSCSVSMWSTARTSTRRSMSRASSARPIPAARTKFAPWVCSIQGVLRRDRHRLDRCRPDLGASPGGRRAVALLPQSRHRRGSIPERVLARAEELAAKRPAARLSAVAAMIYLIFNEGYSASGDTAEIRSTLCEEAIHLARLLLRLFQSEPEIMGLTALLMLQHARAAARFDADGALILLDDQDRSLWNQKMIAEGLALIDKAMRHRRGGPYQIQAAIAALHARAAKPDETDWAQIDLLYGALEVMQPSPVVTLNRAVAVSKVRGPQAALEMIEPLAARLSNYFHFFGVRGAFLMQLGRNDEARVAFDRAIALANTSAEAAHIRMHLDRLMRDSKPRDKKAEK